jgi:hypothetical protein
MAIIADWYRILDAVVPRIVVNMRKLDVDTTGLFAEATMSIAPKKPLHNSLRRKGFPPDSFRRLS